MYPRIGFFRKLSYPRIRILPIPIRVSVSVLHRVLLVVGAVVVGFVIRLCGFWAWFTCKQDQFSSSY